MFLDKTSSDSEYENTCEKLSTKLTSDHSDPRNLLKLKKYTQNTR